MSSLLQNAWRTFDINFDENFHKINTYTRTVFHDFLPPLKCC